MALDIDTLWNYNDPALSEQRFRDALVTAQGDDALILQTQIARSLGLRLKFVRAREVLAAIEPQLDKAGAEVRVRHALEFGRTLSSTVHPPETQSPEVQVQARAAYRRAIEWAREARLDGLAIDAMHMMACVDTAPADQLKWAREALAVAGASSQPEAKKWEASLRNNAGYALHQLGRYEEALAEFKQALTLRERGTNAGATRVAHWMIAWTLRALKRPQEAITIQLRLEQECAAADEPDEYVFEELETLYREQGDAARAEHYAGLKKALAK